MEKYQPRILDRVLSEYLEGLPAICIDGAKGVGKTSTALQQAKSAFKLDDASARMLLDADPGLIKVSKRPVLLDEWQRLPQVWDQVRRCVDEDGSSGQYILTGSAYPKDTGIHSGAGRIVHLRMRPLSIEEREIGTPTVRVEELLSNREFVSSGTTDVVLADYLDEIARSGFPEINRKSTSNARIRIKGYIDNIVEREFKGQGYTLRKPASLKNWLAAYAAAIGSTASYTTILDAATPGEPNKPAQKTTRSYRDVLDQLWLIDGVPPWLPLGSHYRYLGKTEKHYLVDPSLAMVLLDMRVEDFYDKEDALKITVRGKTVLGRFFEALVAQSLQTYALANDAILRHFRSSNSKREIDFIIQRGKRILAIEVKLTASPTAHDCDNLNWFEKEFPEFSVTKCIVTAGKHALTMKNGVHVIPAALLGA